jgi:uncharacterized protein YggU (UPF0235/DUF167 family)
MIPELPWIRLGECYVTVEINVRPSSRKRGLLSTYPSGPVIGLLSAPEKGRANRELIDYIAGVAGVPASAVSIIRGPAARRKVIRIETAAPHNVAARLREMASA